MNHRPMIAAALLACAVGAATAQKATPTQDAKATQQVNAAARVDGINGDAVTLVDFTKRINAYLDIHKKAAGDAPPLKQTHDAAQIFAAQEALAARIRAERATAKPGDIFTPAIRDKFRRLMYPELKGEDGSDAKKVLKDDAPAAVTLKVNSKYTAESLPSVPSNLLLNLPTLPKPLEYRIIQKDLILLDVDANIIVDFIPGAIR